MRNLLARQIKKYFGGEAKVPPGANAFIAAIDNAYGQADADRAMLERSLELSSQEMLQANAEVVRTVSLLTATLEATADGILVVDRERRVVGYNTRFIKMWRIPEELAAKKDDAQLLKYITGQLSEPEAFLVKVEDLYTKLDVEDNDVVRFKDGRVFERFSLPQRVGGKIVGRVWSFRDVSERQQAEDALKQEQIFSNSIINSIPGPFYVLDEKGSYVRWNAYQRDVIIGKSDEQAKGMSAAETIHPDDRAAVAAKIANVLEHGLDESVEGRVLLRGGPAFRWFQMTGRQMQLGGKKFLVGIGVDITESKRVEEEIARTKATLQTIIETVPFAIIVVGRDKKIRRVNKTALEMAGYGSSEELVGHVCHETLCPASVGKCPIIDLKQKLDNSEKTLITKDKSVIPILKSVVPIILDGEEVLLETFINITDIKKLENELREKMHDLEQFHDLTVGRELKMMELEAEIERLKQANHG
jgi:PAS domain S-box-containing protein